MTISPESIRACQRIRAGIGSVMGRIIAEVAEECGISPATILGRDKTAPIARARQIVMFEARKAGFSLTQIGRVLGRDHTTILAGIRREIERRAAE